jgi:hypothetical protein
MIDLCLHSKTFEKKEKEKAKVSEQKKFLKSQYYP